MEKLKIFTWNCLRYGEQIDDNIVFKLKKKALYGLKQLPCVRFERFTKVMLGFGFKQSQGDHILFIKQYETWGIIVLLVYVDEVIVTGDDEEEQQ